MINIREKIGGLVCPIELGPETPNVQLRDGACMPISMIPLNNLGFLDEMDERIVDILKAANIGIFDNADYEPKAANGKPRIIANPNNHILEDTNRIALSLSTRVLGLVEEIAVVRPSTTDNMMLQTILYTQKPEMRDVYYTKPEKGQLRIVHPDARLHPQESLHYVAQAIGATSL